MTNTKDLSKFTTEFKLSYGKELDQFFKRNHDWKNETFGLNEGEYLNDKFDLIYSSIIPSWFNVLIADTGIGKTEFAKNLFNQKEFNNIIFIAPLEIIVKEITNDLTQSNGENSISNFIVCNKMDNYGMVELKSGLKTIIVCTYHEFVKNIDWIQQVDLLVIDEIHWLHTYSFAGNLCGKMLTAIKYLRNKKCTILGLTATASLIIEASQWFFVDKFIHIVTNKIRIPPKQIILYPGYGTIPNTQLVKHYLQNYVDFEKEKVLVVIDGGNEKNTTFSNFVLSLKSFTNVQISAQKSENKMDNADVQYIIEFKRLTDDTKMFIATVWISNGVNIYDETIKHIIVLSDQPNIVKQTVSRIRIPNAVNLVIFQQFRKIERTIPYEEIDNYLTNAAYNIIAEESKFEKFNKIKKWDTLGMRHIWNPIPILQFWYELNEKNIFANFENLVVAMKAAYPKVKLIIIGQEYLNQSLSKKNIKIVRDLLRFNFTTTAQLSNKKLLEHFGIIEKKDELYTKIQMNKLLKEKGLNWDMVENVYDENKHKKYKLKN